jgi:phosphopantothenoylcysteine decarboxylase/phosphopantothenate--cysteine ligase
MNIVLGITGSIASYKSYDVTRLLVKKGHSVRIVLTKGALEFIKPETFRYLGAEKIYLPDDDFKLSQLDAKSTVLHIELAKWADKVIVAPLSANTLNRIALGLNNDLLVSLLLALGKKTTLLFPAMNTSMWMDPRTQRHVSELSESSHLFVVNPASGLLACGDIGEGKFPEVEAVVDLIETINPIAFKKETIVVTAGATAAPLDPVRYLTNPSIGKMGLSIAKEFLKEGFRVVLLAGHNCTSQVENLSGHPQFELVKAPTTELMKRAALKYFPEASAYISTGAIADIEFDTAKDKIKKESMGNNLPFHQASDIIKEIISIKKPHQKIVSFAAETETTEDVFMEKMQRKPVDLMVGNRVSNGLIDSGEVQGFQKNEGDYYFIESNKINGPISLSKSEVGKKIIDWYQGHLKW